MTQCIILTEAQAKALCGDPIKPLAMVSAPWAALIPSVLADGVRYVLPADLLSNPDFAEVHDQLAAFPVAEVADDEFSRPSVTG